MSSDAVRAALESGLWREKKDQKSGRSYFVNTQTRVSVWDLARELARSQPTTKTTTAKTKGKDTAESLTAERKEQARRWQQQESNLTERVMALEREKVRLESEITVLQEPARAEAEVLQEQHQQLCDAKKSLEAIMASDLQLRREKTMELQQLQTKLDTLRLNRQQELEAFAVLKKRLAQLQQEHAEAVVDLEREENLIETLREEHNREERLLEDAIQEEARLKEFMKIRSGEVDRMKAELKGLCQRKAELQQYHQQLAAEMAEDVKDINEDRSQEGLSSSMPLLSHLQDEVSRRRKSLQQLKQKQHLVNEAEWMEVESAELQHLRASTNAEVRQLALFTKELSDQVRVVLPLVESIKRDVEKLMEELET
ncbi:uncharacterized protein TM35_000221360 [Trypanosoma theileri]|uniref:WW domain-containing protein n=1 Tax=Trypanosoma theileri TaxID=67003 RepID=A0A1X0NRM2_9TRYP|nr:uncharacterized protein TM35_000221360 [Trypanosoma theileri]ORC87337.1 hypothetical protein TM35_000221360 [Trypanosoma theileri]